LSFSPVVSGEPAVEDVRGNNKESKIRRDARSPMLAMIHDLCHLEYNEGSG